MSLQINAMDTDLARALIQTVSNHITEAVEHNRLHQLFHTLLPSLGEVLAKAHPSFDEASLGRLRGPSTPDELTSVTILDGEHQPYADKLTELFASELSLDVTGTKTIKYPYTPTHSSETPCISEVQLFDDAHDLTLPLHLLPKKLTVNLEVDQYILATKETKLDWLFVARTHYLTWISIHSRGSGTPIERMSLEKKAITVIPLDNSKVAKSLELVSHLFELAVRCNYQEPMQPDLLKKCVALFRYAFAEVRPYVEGSGPIGELLEAAIYDHHGYRSTLTDKINVEAVTSLSFQKFFDQYDTLRVIEKLETPTEAKVGDSAA